VHAGLVGMALHNRDLCKESTVRLLHLKTILAATDLTKTSDSAARSAERLASAAGASLHVAHVAPESAGIVGTGGVRAEYAQTLGETMARLGISTGYTPHVPVGAPVSELAALADRLEADVIVMGRMKSKAAVPVERPLGGTAYAVITHSRVSCLAIRRELTLPLRHVLVAIDHSEASRGAMLLGLSWASALRERGDAGTRLTAVKVDEKTGTDSGGTHEKSVDDELDILRGHGGDWAGVSVRGVAVPGDDVAGVIAAQARELGADLVVAGTRGQRAGPDGTLGSVSARLLSRIDAPILLVPPAVWRNHARDVDRL
jgi:nucleotide-binding universal stress UspA family protein